MTVRPNDEKTDDNHQFLLKKIILQMVSVNIVDNDGNGDDDHNQDGQDVDNDNDEGKDEEEEESKYCGEKQSGAVLLPTIHISRPHSPASE